MLSIVWKNLRARPRNWIEIEPKKAETTPDEEEMIWFVTSTTSWVLSKAWVIVSDAAELLAYFCYLESF